MFKGMCAKRNMEAGVAEYISILLSLVSFEAWSAQLADL